MSERTFTAALAVRGRCPLLVGLVGPSGSGKTFSALRLAKGMAGDRPFFLVDTENGRALHYADQFRFQHVPFAAPFSPLDYLDAVRYAADQGAAVIVVDSMSHEHEGEGGVLEWHEREVQRLSGGDHGKAERVNMLAWSAPKQARRRMVAGLLQTGAHLVCCWRAKEKLRIRPGKAPEPRGWQPIGGEEWIYEMTANLFLPPGAGGKPDLRPETADERAMVKIPSQFAALFGRQLDEETGAELAAWAEGRKRQPEQAAPAEQQRMPEGQRTEWLAAIMAGETMEAVRSAFGAAFKAAKKLGDEQAVAELQARYEARKAELLGGEA